MESHLFWFNDEQWAKIAPHLPTNQPGPLRKDDRLILSGIMHVLKIGHLAEDIRDGRRSFRAAETSRAG